MGAIFWGPKIYTTLWVIFARNTIKNGAVVGLEGGVFYLLDRAAFRIGCLKSKRCEVENTPGCDAQAETRHKEENEKHFGTSTE